MSNTASALSLLDVCATVVGAAREFPFVQWIHSSSYMFVSNLCVCVRGRQGRRRIPATVRWFSDGSEIAAELWEEWQGWSVWGRGWHRPLPPGLPLQRWMTARGWYQVSSCWHISLIEPHSLHLRTVTHTASHNSLHANRSSRRAVLRARRPPGAKPQGPD